MRRYRTLLAVGLVAVTGFLGYRVLVVAVAADAPPGDLGERLKRSPLDGDAFGDFATASTSRGDARATRALHEIAVRRDPRDLRVRAWLADVHLRAGQYPRALEQLDVILRLSPSAQKALVPMMAQWADDPAFADALVASLRTRPPWRDAVVSALRADIGRTGADAVFGGLVAAGDVDRGETARWLDALMKAGEWGLAYSYWASGLDLAPGQALPMLYNGGFEQAPTQSGFDWRTEQRSGTYTEFEPAPGARGNAAHVVFRGRPAAGADLEQALPLPPGAYRIGMRLKTVALRSDQGLHWTLTCHGQPGPLAAGERLDGTLGWHQASLEFEIPAAGCPGQWLRLDNPAPPGSAQMVSGEMWIDDMVLRPATGMAFDTDL